MALAKGSVVRGGGTERSLNLAAGDTSTLADLALSLECAVRAL